jgi:hypothetical protein
MNIKKLTELLGKALAEEVAAEDQAKQEGEFTILDMVETTGWGETTVRRKLAPLLKDGRIVRRGKSTVYYKAAPCVTRK